MKTVIDAVIYYCGYNFINGKHEENHTHIISIHKTERIGTAYASDIGMNAIICGIKTYNDLISELETNFGTSVRYSEYKKEFDKVSESKWIVGTKYLFSDNGDDWGYGILNAIGDGEWQSVSESTIGSKFEWYSHIKICEPQTKGSKMIPFDLEKALAGEKVIRRSGKEVTQIAVFKTNRGEFISGVIEGVLMHVMCEGDLFMAPKSLSGFVVVYSDGVIGNKHSTRKFAELAVQNSIDNECGCSAIIDLSQFEEGHGL